MGEAITRLRIERVGRATVQDLGRSGLAEIGVSVNGALDQHAARTANVLVGNTDPAPLIEVTGSELTFVSDADALLAVTGAADCVVVQGQQQPAWETVAVSAGSRVTVPVGRQGLRSYLAVNGRLDGDRVLGSVAPDPLLDVGHRLESGMTVVVHTAYRQHPAEAFGALFRFGAVRPNLTAPVRIEVTTGPELDRLRHGQQALGAPYVVLPESDHVGLRLDGPKVKQLSTGEILSRGVPVGAVEVVPSGDVIILLRGRLVTAGYPVVAVATTESLDRLGQVRPGDEVVFDFCEATSARTRLRAQYDGRRALAGRVRSAFTASGIGSVLDPRHGDPDPSLGPTIAQPEFGSEVEHQP